MFYAIEFFVAKINVKMHYFITRKDIKRSVSYLDEVVVHLS